MWKFFAELIAHFIYFILFYFIGNPNLVGTNAVLDLQAGETR